VIRFSLAVSQVDDQSRSEASAIGVKSGQRQQNMSRGLPS
jgi:hypothetical protein